MVVSDHHTMRDDGANMKEGNRTADAGEVIDGGAHPGWDSQHDTQGQQNVVKTKQRRDDPLMALADPTAPRLGIRIDVRRWIQQPPYLLFEPSLRARARVD